MRMHECVVVCVYMCVCVCVDECVSMHLSELNWVLSRGKGTSAFVAVQFVIACESEYV